MLSNPIDTTTKVFKKTFTFTGGAGLGATGTTTFVTVTGGIHIVRIVPVITTTLTAGAGATQTLGIVGALTQLLAATLASAMTANLFWTGTTPVNTLALPAAFKDTDIYANIAGTTAVNAITAGVIQFMIEYIPLTSDAALA